MMPIFGRMVRKANPIPHAFHTFFLNLVLLGDKRWLLGPSNATLLVLDASLEQVNDFYQCYTRAKPPAGLFPSNVKNRKFDLVSGLGKCVGAFLFF